MNNLQHHGLKEALQQKSQYLTERKATDQKVLERLTTHVERLTPELNSVAPEVQTQLSKRIKNFQISARKTTAERDAAVGEIIQMLEKEIPKKVPTVQAPTVEQQRSTQRLLDVQRLELRRWGEFFGRTVKSEPSSYIDALSQELQTDVATWKIATFAQANLYKRPTVVYRREYFLQYGGARPAPLSERDILDPLEKPVLTALHDADGKAVETLTADERLPSPLFLSEGLRQVLARGREGIAPQEMIARLGDPRVLAKWLGCFYLAIERGLFDDKERAAVAYIRSVVADYFVQTETQKRV